jgi:uncharacterized protein YggU (UPF0235/DUF167 family)
LTDFVVHLTPRGGADRVDGVRDGTLRVRVAAPPVGGAANEALVGFIARELAVSRSAVRIVTGRTSRTKRVDVDGVSAGSLAARWPGLRV